MSVPFLRLGKKICNKKVQVVAKILEKKSKIEKKFPKKHVRGGATVY